MTGAIIFILTVCVGIMAVVVNAVVRENDSLRDENYLLRQHLGEVQS